MNQCLSVLLLFFFFAVNALLVRDYTFAKRIWLLRASSQVCDTSEATSFAELLLMQHQGQQNLLRGKCYVSAMSSQTSMIGQ